MKKKGRLLIALAIVIVMTLSIVLMACDDTGYKVTFVTNEGTPVAELTDCKAIETEPTTTREGYTFKGWFTNAELTGDKVTFPLTITADTTLYASWEKKAEEKPEPEPEEPKFTSAGDVFSTAASMLYGTIADVVASINSKTLGYDINAVLGMNDTKYHFDLSTAINLENVGVGALVNFETVTGDVSTNAISVQVHNGDVYYKNGDKAVKMPFLGIDSLLALVVGETGIDFSQIEAGWSSIEGYLGMAGGVLFNEGFTYDKDTNSATISVSNDVLAGKLDTIFGILGGGINIQQMIDELAFNSLGIPYEINLQEIVSAFNFNLELTLDLTEDDALESFGIVLTLGESNLEFKRLASCPTYDEEGNRTVVYDRHTPEGDETEGKIITKELNITANEISFNIAFNDRTTEIAAPEGKFDEINLINFDVTGKVILRDTNPADGQVSDYTMDLLVKSNIDITKLISIVDGKIVANKDGFATAGYFRLNLTAPNQTVQANEDIGVKAEIVYDPANSGDTNIYIYFTLVQDNPFTVTVNMSDLVDYIISNQKPVVTPADPEVTALANSNIADTAVNGLIDLVNKFVGSMVITEGITVGNILDGVDYSYENGLTVGLNFIDTLLYPIVGDLINKELIVGTGRDSVVVKVENISAFTAETNYNAYELCKNLAYVKSVKLDAIEVNYDDDLTKYMSGDDKNIFNSTLTLTDGSTLANNEFVVLKTEGYNATEPGEQTVTVYGYAIKQSEIIFGMVGGMVKGIPFGLIKTTLNVTVREQITDATVSVNELINLSSSNIKTALGAKINYTYDGIPNEERVAASNISFLNKDKNPIEDITAIGTYYARVDIYNLQIDVPFTVYSTTLPSSNFTQHTFRFGTSIESIISQYSYSYKNDQDETVTVPFSLDSVIVTKGSALTDTTNILDEGGAITFVDGITTAYVKFTIAINDDTTVISKGTGTIAQIANTLVVNETFETAYSNNSAIDVSFSSVRVYSEDGKTSRLLYPLVTKNEDGTTTFEIEHRNSDTKYAVTSVKIFDGESDITETIYDATTKLFKSLEGLDYDKDKKLTAEITFVSPEIADTNFTSNHTYTFRATFNFQNLDESLQFSTTEISAESFLDGMVTMNRIANGLKSTATLTYVPGASEEVAGKYVMAYWGTAYGDVTITVMSGDQNVTDTVLVDGKFVQVTKDTKYTVTFAFTAAADSGLTSDTATQEITVKPAVYEPTLEVDGTPQLYYGEVFSLPLIYSDAVGVKHNIYVQFKTQVLVDIDFYNDPYYFYEYKKFALVKNAAGDSFFTDGRKTANDYELPIFATVTVAGVYDNALPPEVAIDPDTGIVSSTVETGMFGSDIKINVTIYGKEFNLTAASIGASARP